MANRMDDEKLQLLLLKSMFNAGQAWLKSLKAESWARRHYAGGHSSVALYDNEVKLANSIKAGAKMGGGPPEFMVLPADPTSEKERHLPVTLMRIVPSTGADGQVARHLNFYVCSHRQNEEGMDQVVVWRIEGPEGPSTDHNFCHMQPLHKIDGFDDACFPQWMPVRFPTFAMAANTAFEATVAACIATSGKPAVVRAVRAHTDLRDAVDNYISRLEVWESTAA